MSGVNWRDRKHWAGGRKVKCSHCRRPCMLLDETGTPAHKVCAERATDSAPGR